MGYQEFEERIKTLFGDEGDWLSRAADKFRVSRSTMWRWTTGMVGVPFTASVALEKFEEDAKNGVFRSA